MAMGSVFGATICLTLATANCAYAQISADGTLPNNSIVAKEGNTFNITGGTQAGSNLFHSFQQFSVPTDGAAIFNNATHIQNIFGRVTGGSVSNIDGIIRASGIANLFLINPSGIIFGQKASLDIKGSFVGTTANAIGFGNQGFFSASAPNNPELLTINPSALLFNQIATAPIQNNSVAQAEPDPLGTDVLGLRVPDGHSLLLVGGDISMNGGRLNAYGGQLELGGVRSTGTVGLNVDGNLLRLSFPQNLERAEISLTNDSQLNVSDGGNINVTTDSLFLSNGARLVTLSFGQTNAGNVNINARDRVLFDGKASDGLNASGIISKVLEPSNANGGDISIKAGALSLTNGAAIFVNTDGIGNTGSVMINTHDSVSLNGSNISNIVSEKGKGNGGVISINTGSLSLTNGSQFFTDTNGMGNSGGVIINARDTVLLDVTQGNDISAIFSRVQSGGVGKGGDIRITTGSLLMNNGSALYADIFGQGDGANVIIKARNNVSFNGRLNPKTATGIFNTVQKSGKGNSGEIRISSDSFSMSNGALLTASTYGQGDAGKVIINARERISLDTGSAILSTVGINAGGKGTEIRMSARELVLNDFARVNVSTDGQRSAGSINITANSLSLTKLSELNAITNRFGDAGNITINASNRIFLDNSKIKVTSEGTGQAGNITIQAGNLTLNNIGLILASTSGTQGGDIKINLKDFLLLRQGSQISTSAGTQRAGGDGGNITINAPSGFIVAGARENNDITANAFSGSGGRVTINAASIFGMTVRTREDLARLLGTNLDPQQLPTNDITAISQASPSLSGTVTVNTLDVDPNRSLVNLPAIPVETSVAQGCNARGTLAKNKFIITGRGGLPPNPTTEPLRASAVQVGWVTVEPEVDKHFNPPISTNSTKFETPPIVEASGWVAEKNGDIVLVATDKNVNPLSQGQTPTSCTPPQ
jgi:filamentous hemagglutinin family protein